MSSISRSPNTNVSSTRQERESTHTHTHPGNSGLLSCWTPGHSVLSESQGPPTEHSLPTPPSPTSSSSSFTPLPPKKTKPGQVNVTLGALPWQPGQKTHPSIC
ncbi:uncharacterized protein ACO6RY_09160 [Pungitius sinensis]